MRAALRLLSAMALVAAGCSDEPGPSGFSDGTPPPSQATLPPGATPTLSPNDTPRPGEETPQPFSQAEIPLQVADSVFLGEAEGDGAGGAIAGVGDLNGDGVDDLALSAPGSDARQPDGGKVYLYFGDDDVGLPWHNDLAEAPASFDGEGRNDRAGAALAGGGDLNGDGLADLLISAPGHTTGGIGAGRIYGLFGKIDGWYPGQRLANADFMLDGAELDEAGETGTVAMGGDLNGDGYDDFAVGCYRSPTYSDEAGHVYVVLGREEGWGRPGTLAGMGPTFVGEREGDRFGFSVAIHPDLNGDGYADLLVGVPRLESSTQASLGAVYLFLGKADMGSGTFTTAAADGVIYGVDAGEELGAGVAALGDVDGDGQPDVAVGAWGNLADEVSATRGRFYVVSASVDAWTGVAVDTVSTRIVGDAPYDYVGRPAADAGDMDGDGQSDLAFGSFLRDYPFQDAGNAYLFFGWQADTLPIGVSLQDADVRMVGEGQNSYAGFALDGVGDVNGDGLGDLMVGAMGTGTDELSRSGKAYLILGRPFYTE